MPNKLWLDENRNNAAYPKVSALLAHIQQTIDDCRGVLTDIENHRYRCFAQDYPAELNHVNDGHHGPDDGTGDRYKAYDQVVKTRNNMNAAYLQLRSAISSASPFGIDHGGGGGVLLARPASPAPHGAGAAPIAARPTKPRRQGKKR